jgi:hypothetical protein
MTFVWVVLLLLLSGQGQPGEAAEAAQQQVYTVGEEPGEEGRTGDLLLACIHHTGTQVDETSCLPPKP